MTEMLNIDDLAKETKVIKLKGVEYPMREMSVSMFIEMTDSAKDITDDMSLGDQMRFTIDMIMRNFPDIPREVLEDLELEKLKAILNFSNGVSAQDIMNGASGADVTPKDGGQGVDEGKQSL